jgi:uncharacterized protein (TIGR01244 family)
MHTLALLVTLLLAGHPGTAPLPDMPNTSRPAPNRIAAGAVEAQDVAPLRAAGVERVINLRTEGETPGFDEAAAMRAAGIDYVSLPIKGADGLTRENVERFARLLAESGDDLTLVHCGGSNRVGALVALQAGWLEGRPLEEAVAEGKRWGLSGLEPEVRKRLAAGASGASSD